MTRKLISLANGRTVTDLTGQRFGRIVVDAPSPRRDASNNTFWYCRCDCGGTSETTISRLRQGKTKSCGCLKRSTSKPKHGLSLTREYRVWGGMIKRCHDPKCKQFKDYGARGIFVCERWRKDVRAFVADMGPCNGLEIERVDNDRGYSPDNCIWADRIAQTANKRNTVFIQLPSGRTPLCLAARTSGIKYATLARRIALGWPPEALLTPPNGSPTKRWEGAE